MRRSRRTDYSKDYPIILTSGRLVEYEGGGDETRSNPWLAELQQDMFVEINPRDANNLGIKDGDAGLGRGAEKAQGEGHGDGDRACRPGVAFMPFHFGGHFQGEDLRKYPKGTDPLCARRIDQHRTDLRLRLGHADAGDQSTLCKIIA
jgi:formate dehydrogenase major subunit